MSDKLKKCAAKLIKLAGLPKRDIKPILKTASRRLVDVLSEIAYNVKNGAVSVTDKIKNSKVVKILGNKLSNLKTKKTVLCTAAAPIVVQIILTACIEILKALCN